MVHSKARLFYYRVAIHLTISKLCFKCYNTVFIIRNLMTIFILYFLIGSHLMWLFSSQRAVLFFLFTDFEPITLIRLTIKFWKTSAHHSTVAASSETFENNCPARYVYNEEKVCTESLRETAYCQMLCEIKSALLMS